MIVLTNVKSEVKVELVSKIQEGAGNIHHDAFATLYNDYELHVDQ